jgi:hypothetical protein
MNAASTWGTAWLRACWGFLAAFLGAGVPDYLLLRYDVDRPAGEALGQALIVGVLAGLAAGGVARGLVEGLHDRRRQRAGRVSPADVQGPGAGNP